MLEAVKSQHRVVSAWRPTRFFGGISFSFRSFFFYISASPDPQNIVSALPDGRVSCAFCFGQVFYDIK